MSHPTFEGGIGGVRIGIVTDTDDPRAQGRVKLRFPWRDADDESPWARIATSMAGDGYGTYFRPEVETEVLVAFADGDIHRPFVVGALWNGTAAPPEGNESGETDVRTVESPDGNRIVIDDTTDDGRLLLETSSGHRVHIDDDRIAVTDASGANSVELDSAAGTVSIAADERIDLEAPTVQLSAESSLTLEGGGGLTLTSDAEIDLTSKGRLRADSAGAMSLNASGPLSATGSLIKLN